MEFSTALVLTWRQYWKYLHRDNTGRGVLLISRGWRPGMLLIVLKLRYLDLQENFYFVVFLLLKEVPSPLPIDSASTIHFQWSRIDWWLLNLLLLSLLVFLSIVPTRGLHGEFCEWAVFSISKSLVLFSCIISHHTAFQFHRLTDLHRVSPFNSHSIYVNINNLILGPSLPSFSIFATHQRLRVPLARAHQGHCHFLQWSLPLCPLPNKRSYPNCFSSSCPMTGQRFTLLSSPTSTCPWSGVFCGPGKSLTNNGSGLKSMSASVSPHPEGSAPGLVPWVLGPQFLPTDLGYLISCGAFERIRCDRFSHSGDE